MGSVEDPDFAKQNDRDSAARPLADIPTKLLKQGLDVPPRQASASSVYGTTAQYQQQPLVNGFLDTDNAAPEWAELKSTPPHFSHWRSTSDPGP
jgi:hypothetical protein